MPYQMTAGQVQAALDTAGITPLEQANAIALGLTRLLLDSSASFEAIAFETEPSGFTRVLMAGQPQ